MPARIQLVGAAACLVIATSLLFVPASAQEDTPPSPTPTPNRAPSYERGAPPGALQLQGPPPSISQVILDDSLQGRGAIPSRWECMTGRNVGEFVGEGYIIKVTGPCGPNSRSAVLAPGFIPGLDIPDGEIRFEFKVVTGHDRAELFVGFRGILNENCYLGYELDAVPGQGEMRIRKYAVGCEPSSAVAGRADLRASFHRDDWNNLAIRLHGANQWVFLNDVLVLSVADSTFDRGAIMIGVARLGNLGDTAESAIVIRNLRVSQLAP